MTDSEIDQMLLENNLEGVKYLVSPNYGDAIIGYTLAGNEPRLVYDYDLMVESLIKEENMDEEEACDFISYNTMRAIPYFGKNTPIIIERVIR